MHRSSLVRQTRSQTRAAQQQATHNLQYSSDAFEPSLIETDRGNEFDCPGCDRANDAEMYMVQCINCLNWYHFSCAKVSTATVNTTDFRCKSCSPVTTVQNQIPDRPRSTTGHSSTSSARQARIALQLQRLEEEKKLQDDLHREQLALQQSKIEKLQRDKEYAARKFALMDQQESSERALSVRSHSSKQASINRVAKWIDGQAISSNAVDVVVQTSEQIPQSLCSSVANPIDVPHTNQTSTPVLKSSENRYADKASAKCLPIPDPANVTLDRNAASINRDNKVIVKSNCARATNPADQLIAPLQLVNVQSFESMLNEVQSGQPLMNTGPKLYRNPSAFEQWRSEVNMLRKQHETKLQDDQEKLDRCQREDDLLEQLNQLKRQKESEAELQRQREEELRRQLSKLERQRHQQLAEQDNELQRLRTVEKEFERVVNLRGQRPAQGAFVPDQLPSNSLKDKTVGSILSQQVDAPQQMNMRSNSRSMIDNHVRRPNSLYLGNDAMSISPPVSCDIPSLVTPVGGRSQYTLSPDLKFIPSQNAPPRMGAHYPAYGTCPPVVDLCNGPTAQQLAARHVVAKELPVFTGDPTEWSLFFSSFTNSTATCGYSNAENLLRLQRCLRGEAKEAVSSLLLSPLTVPQVMSTLQTLYGRPERMVQHLISKVRNTPAPTSGKMDTLVRFGLAVQNLCSHLKAVGLENHLSNPSLLQELVAKLPDNVKFNWALHQQQLATVDLVTFSEYMANVAIATSSVVSLGGCSKKTVGEERGRAKEKAYVNAHAKPEQAESFMGKNPQELSGTIRRSGVSNEGVGPQQQCPACNNCGHSVRNCFTFKRLSLDDRWHVVKEKKLCRRCLTAHARWPYKGEVCSINGCQKRHHRLLHSDKYQIPQDAVTSADTPNVHATVTIHRQITSSTLFRVLPVVLYGKKGRVETYAFLDDGSSVTLVEKSIANLLGVHGATESLCIQWTGGIDKKIPDTQRVELEISGVNSLRRHKATNVYTVDNLGLPEQTIEFDAMAKEFAHLRNLPVTSFKSAVPGILIGLSNVHLLATLKLREGLPHEPIAAKTRIGWAVYGNFRKNIAEFKHRQFHIYKSDADCDLHDYVRQFFSLENVGVAAGPMVESADDKRACEILQRTTKRTASGRFETGLLWREDQIRFPNSRKMAEKRLTSLEKRLKKNPVLYENVRQQITEFQSKGYAHRATAEELASFDPLKTWFLPLGIVIHPRKPDRVRVIWDAAAEVEGVSLNSMLMKGPDLLTPLMAVLFQYREREVAISADIKEMFHQVGIRTEDRSAQLFLWRDSTDSPVETMVTDVAIFGATCSPTHSQYVKNLNATEWEGEFPEAAAAIKSKHYVDDYLDSVDTIDEAVTRALDVAMIHAKAGFHIRNWLSNHPVVLERIGETNPATVKGFATNKESGYERLLGMVWIPMLDVFSYSLKFRDDVQTLILGYVVPTKRDLLKVVMSLYDPLGLVAAFVIQGKILIQEVWRSKIGWDDPIPVDIFGRWKLWLGMLRKLESVQIQRCYFPGYNPESYKSLELHIFVDASEQAYAAAAYFRIIDRGVARCVLVSAKTKVAPLEPVSIPRLELMAAVIGSRLRKTIEQDHSLEIKRTYFWSDSTTVMSWIKSDTRRYRQFVAFRVSEILSLSSEDEWRWVPTRLNIADEATKWGKGPSFPKDCRWFNGPEFLYDNESEWPKDCRLSADETKDELRPAFIGNHHVVEKLINPNRFSKWERMLRSVAYIVRFTENLKCKIKKMTVAKGDLTSEELLAAERILWKMAQQEAFPDDIAVLKNNANAEKTKLKRLDKTSQLVKLPPLIDEFGVLRVDGRLAAAEYLAYDTKFPIILPRGFQITNLLLDYYHRRFRHANNETIINEVKQKFHIPRIRSAVRQIKMNCMQCRVSTAVPVAPKMGVLPRARVTPFMRPFTFVGLDYFGPYYVQVGRSSVKRWVALFTCLTVRAIHLELVANLSTDSCKKAIRRFIARRGAPQEIYSDNGTNFVGASRELEAEKRMINENLSSTFTDTHTRWRFNPPSAPHMGGCWERMVRSVKTALYAIPLEGKLDEECLTTLLAETEHMVNSRPLTFVPLETAGAGSLTPNDFLMLSSSGVKQPIKDAVTTGAALKHSWNKIQRVLEQIWRRWVTEYLPTITRRTKWFDNVRPIAVGDLVLLVDENVRNRWLRGRVVRTFPGKDGAVRQADVQTMTGIVRRPVVKIALLDVGIEDDAEQTSSDTGGRMLQKKEPGQTPGFESNDKA